MRTAILRFCFLLLLASAACVTTAQEGEQMRKDIAALRADLKKEIDDATQERQKLADEQAARAKALQEALDQLSRAARKSGVDLAVDLEKAQNDVTALRGQIEVLQHRLEAALPGTRAYTRDEQFGYQILHVTIGENTKRGAL